MDNLKTQRIVMRPFSEADAAEAFACLTERKSPYTAWSPPRNKEEFRRVWQGWLQGARDGTEMCLTARLAESDGFIGLAGLMRIRSGRPEIGIWIRTDAQGQGHGYEMVRALVQRASARFRPDHFRYPVALENRPSRRIAERLGGTIVGRYRTQKYDGVIYAIPPMR